MENVFFIKVHVKVNTGDIFFSFILHADGNIDIIINNYNGIIITKEHLNIIIHESNEIIERINNNHIYSNKKIEDLELHNNIDMEYFNCDMNYSLEYFVDKSGKYSYKKNNYYLYYFSIT